MKWIMESNRLKHFGYAVPSAFILTILFVAGLAVGMEFKDRAYGGKWDWLDLAATLLGGVVGQLLQCLAVYLVAKCVFWAG
ncbi:MAG: hypothetical protein IJ379_13385 [Lachnospiraceae bacterium]|nr:hypothetical protein [Lachnospiraceae bacterium]